MVCCVLFSRLNGGGVLDGGAVGVDADQEIMNVRVGLFVGCVVYSVSTFSSHACLCMPLACQVLYDSFVLISADQSA